MTIAPENEWKTQIVTEWIEATRLAELRALFAHTPEMLAARERLSKFNPSPEQSMRKLRDRLILGG